MKKIVPFKHDLFFKENIDEITSISLEHTLKSDSNNQISGEFIITGEYKITKQSINVDKFEFNAIKRTICICGIMDEFIVSPIRSRKRAGGIFERMHQSKTI